MKLASISLRLSACKLALLSASIFSAASGAASAATLFEDYLERGYAEVAAYARVKAQNPEAGIHFEQKAVDAGRGLMVMPDSPADTGRPLAQLVELYDSHTRLMEALAAGAADDNARMAAVAQVNFDCWLAQLSAAPTDPDSSSCRLLFYTALDQIAVDDSEIVEIATGAGPADATATSDNRAGGGNDNPDRWLPPRQVAALPADEASNASPDRIEAGPISALSPAAPGEYATAAWIYPPPTTLPAPGSASGAASEGSAGAGLTDGLTDGDAGGGVAGALGGAVGNTSNSLGGAVSSLGGGLGGAVGDVSDTAGGAISDVGGAIGGPVGGVAEASGAAVSGAGNALGGAVSGVAGAAGGAVSGLGGAVGGALGGLGRGRPN